jgi:hypothetical protein
MQNKNDKIVELIKAYLDGKTLQPTVHHFSGCYSGMDGTLKALMTTVIAHPDSFKIKPETKKVHTRTWVTANNKLRVWDSEGKVLQLDVEAYSFFKQWLDAAPRIYEVEV